MLIFALFISFTLAANASLLSLFDWLSPNDSVLDPYQEKSNTDFVKESSSPGSYSGSGAFFDGPEYPPFEHADSNVDIHPGDADSPYLAGTINNDADCPSYEEMLQPSRKKPRAESFCPSDQNLKNNQQDAAGERSDEGNTESEISESEDTSFSHLPDDIPLLDFNSIDRTIGYCPEVFYGFLTIPVCASADPAYIKTTLLVYYNLDHAMRGIIISLFQLLSLHSTDEIPPPATFFTD